MTYFSVYETIVLLLFRPGYMEHIVGRAIHHYYVFFDQQLTSSTLIVLFISVLVSFLGIISPLINPYAHTLKTNTLELHNELYSHDKTSYMIIDGIKYEVQMQRVYR